MYNPIGNNINDQTVYECDKCGHRTLDPLAICNCDTVADKHYSECMQIAKYQDENQKLKALLDTAMADLEYIGSCDNCAYVGTCKPSDKCTWLWHRDLERSAIK